MLGKSLINSATNVVRATRRQPVLGLLLLGIILALLLRHCNSDIKNYECDPKMTGCTDPNKLPIHNINDEYHFAHHQAAG